MKIQSIIAISVSIIGCLFICSCQKNSDVEPQNKLNIIELKSVGEVVPGASYDVTNCIPEGSEATLRSFRHIGPYSLYYMDNMANVDWGELLYEPSNRVARYDSEESHKRANSLLYRNPPHFPIPLKSSACSGFVCYNEENELLFGRNFDGDTQPLVVSFNKAVKAGEYKSVTMTVWPEETQDLTSLLLQPMYMMDGMNEKGFCLAAFELPYFQNSGEYEIVDPMENKTPRPWGPDQQTGKKQLTTVGLLYNILSRCATVSEAIDFLHSVDYTATEQFINIHLLVADASGEYRILEYWKDSDGNDVLLELTSLDRYYIMHEAYTQVPYEYYSIENYYCNLEAQRTHIFDYWQREYSHKTRVGNMMGHYSPVMSEEEALRCLQYGNFGLDVIGYLTDWSCVYNPQERTMIFNMHDDLSNVYSIDLTKDL